MRVRAGVGARALGGELVAWGSSLVLWVASASALAAGSVPSNMLLTIDQNRAAVVDRIVGERGDAMLQSGAGITPDQLRAMLMQLRADQLFAASIAGTLDGVRDVIARSLVGTDPINPALLHPVSSSSDGAALTKAIGDSGDDVVYTPVTPCRLVETRGTFPAVYQGNGTPAHTANPFAVGEVRTYTIKSGNGVCISQLGAGVLPVAVQLQVFGIPTTAASGDIEILPQGSTFGSTAAEVFIGSIAFNTVSTTAKINTASNEISVQVRGGKANLAMDVVGYFERPGNIGSVTVTGLFATIGGGDDQLASGEGDTIAGGLINTASNLVSTVGGGNENSATGEASVVSGGLLGKATGDFSTVVGGANNQATGDHSTVLGGHLNTASGSNSIAAGSYAVADQTSCAVFELWGSVTPMNCGNLSEVFRIGATHGLSVDYYSELNSGFGARWVAFGDFFADTTIGTWTGAYLSDGGTWTNNSDRDSKVQVAGVDASSILAKVASLPISTWRYKVEKDQIHLGPMAQDFRAAFGLGMDEKHIATIDEDGVALAAIQALYLQERKKDEQILELTRRLDLLESQRALPVATP